MFCATTDTIQSLTEKTKLLAQKCSQQILSSTPSCVAPNYNNESMKIDNEIQQIPKTETGQSMTILQLACAGNGGNTIDSVNNSFNNSNSIKDDFKNKCLCACKGTIGRFMTKKSPVKDRTTKWYIKVKHN